MMSCKIKLLMAVLIWVVLGATSALAATHNHSGHQQSQSSDIAGPFDGKKEAGSLHCLLKGHTDRVLCPHSNAGGSLAASIATDCGGKTSGAIPSISSFSKNLVVSSAFHENPVFCFSKNMMEIPSLYVSPLSSLLTPPPRII